jgi:ketosteroid isomerase-like protein
MHLQISTIARLTPTALSLVCAMFLGTGIVHAASTDEEAVRKVVNGFPEAWNRHDMNAYGALFTPDADFVNLTGTHWKGRESIQLNTAFLHGAIPEDSAGVTLPKSAYGVFKTSNLTLKQVDVRFLRKDVAVAHVQLELQGDARTKDDPRKDEPRHFLLVYVLTKENGRWLVAVGQNTEITRPPL